MEIGKVSEASGLAASTIRYYESLGILPRPSRNSGRRLYSTEVLVLLKLICLARELGFGVKEMKALFSGFRSNEKVPSAHWRQMATAKLEEIKNRKAQLSQMEILLSSALACNCVSLDACEFLLAK